MAAPYATSDDVAAGWRPLSTDEASIADTKCARASRLLRAEFPGLDDQVTSGAVDPDTLTDVVASMVQRSMLGGGEGVSSSQETVGPFSRSFGYANPNGDLYLTAGERRLILGYQPSAGSHTYGNDTRNCEPHGRLIYGP